MDKIKPTKKQYEYLAYVRKRKTPVDVQEMSLAKYVSASAAREILEKLTRYGYLEKFNQEGLNGVVRPHYKALPVTKSKPIPKPKPKPKPEVKVEAVVEVKPVEQPTQPTHKYTHLKDVYDESNYEANIELLAKELINYLEKDLNMRISFAPAPKEDERANRIIIKSQQDPNAPPLTKEQKKAIRAEMREAERKKRVERERLARKQHLKDMTVTWFPAWAHIQSFRFNNPTGRLRTSEEINYSLKTGTL